MERFKCLLVRHSQKNGQNPANYNAIPDLETCDGNVKSEGKYEKKKRATNSYFAGLTRNRTLIVISRYGYVSQVVVCKTYGVTGRFKYNQVDKPNPSESLERG